MGGRGSSSGTDWRTSAGRPWQTKAERKADSKAEKARVDKIYKEAMAREASMTESERKNERINNLAEAIKQGAKRNATGRYTVTIGGDKFSTEKQIDDHYNREKKISQQMFENIQYDNKQYGMNKGLTIGGKRMTSAKQINNYYDKKAKEAKQMLKNLNG